jgi:subtilisin family serine protease
MNIVDSHVVTSIDHRRNPKGRLVAHTPNSGLLHTLRAPGRTMRRAFVIALALLIGFVLLVTGVARIVPTNPPHSGDVDSATKWASTILSAFPPPAPTVAGQRIAGQYVVVLKNLSSLHTPTQVRRAARELASRHHGRLKHVYTAALRGFSIELAAANVHALGKDSRVAYVEQDSFVERMITQPNPSWNLDRVDQPNPALSDTYSNDTNSANVSMYFMDTGVRFSHVEFGGRVHNVPPFTDTNDCDGHGTSVAGAAAATTWGVAKQAILYSVRVLGCEGAGPATDAISAVDWITVNAKRPAVVNISWLTGPQAALDDAIRNSIKAGITYVVAAGNSNADSCNFSPQRVKEAITVGATDRTDARAGWSNYGSCVDLFAPGTDIATTGHDSDTATTRVSGTSLAAPIAAGAAALYLADHPTATPGQVHDALVNCAATDAISNLRSGSPNRLLNTQCNKPITVSNPGRQVTAKGIAVDLRKLTAKTINTGQTLVYSVAGLPEGLSISSDTGVISGVPTKTGTTIVDVKVTDGTDGSASSSFAWEVVGGYGPVTGVNALCLDDRAGITNNGNPIQLWGCNQSAPQLWTVRSDGRLEVLGKCMTVAGDATTDGAAIVISGCGAAASQIWQPGAGGTLLNPASGKCLNAPASGWFTTLTLATCTGTQNQQWKLPTGAPPNVLRVTNPGVQSTIKGNQVSLRIIADSRDTTQSLTYRASGLPAGLSLNSTTGMISGIPTTSGASNVTVTVTDGSGMSGSASYVWQVADGLIHGVDGKCVDDWTGDTRNGTKIGLWGCNEGAAQMWTVQSDGRLQVLGKCMTVSGNGTADGTPIVLDDCRAAGSQIWQPQENATLLNPASGKCLNAPSPDTGTQLTIATCTTKGNQTWSLPTARTVTLSNPGPQNSLKGTSVNLQIKGTTANTGQPLSFRSAGLPAGLSINSSSGLISGTPIDTITTYVTITAIDSTGASNVAAFVWRVSHGPIVGVNGMCVDDRDSSTANGNRIVLKGCDKTAAQLWTVRSDGRLAILDKCMTVSGDGRADGTPIVLFDCGTAESQIWQPKPNGALLNPASGRCLNAPSAAQDAQLTLADCTAMANQQWKLPNSPTVTVTNPGTQLTAAGFATSLQVVAATNTDESVSYAAAGLPVGLSIDSTTGLISGLPTAPSTSTVTVTARIATGTWAATSFVWQVVAPKTGPITAAGGTCIDNQSSLTANGNPLQLWGCNQTPAQLWTFRSDGRLEVLGVCMTVAGDGTSADSPVVISGCGTAGSQVWQPQANGTLVNPASGKCLNAPASGWGIKLNLATCTGNANQQWRLPPSAN